MIAAAVNSFANEKRLRKVLTDDSERNTIPHAELIGNGDRDAGLLD